MSNKEDLQHADKADIATIHNGDGHAEHAQSFWTKYIFSQDHKMIAKQFLITGMIWAIIGAAFSVLFRIQLGYPGERFPWLETIFRPLGRRRCIKPRILLCNGHHARHHYDIFCIDGRTKRHLCQLPYSAAMRRP